MGCALPAEIKSLASPDSFRRVWCYTSDKVTPLRNGSNASPFYSQCRSRREETVEESRSLILDTLMISWGVITTVLVILVIYRGTLSTKEDDQIFIDAAEQHHFQEQQAIIARMSRLTRPIITLAVVSGALLLIGAGIWIYQGFKSF